MSTLLHTLRLCLCPQYEVASDGEAHLLNAALMHNDGYRLYEHGRSGARFLVMQVACASLRYACASSCLSSSCLTSSCLSLSCLSLSCLTSSCLSSSSSSCLTS